MTQWHTPDTARDQWDDAHGLDDDKLAELLEVARGQVVAYAPERKADPIVAADSTDVPVAYRLAQLRQAQNMWAAQHSDSSGGMGDGAEFELRPISHPLDWHVKQIIRPKGAAPRVR